MAAKRTLKVFAVEDCKIRKVLTDNASATTYGPALDVPGIKRVTITGEVNTVTLRGDNRALDSQTTITGLTATFDHALLSFDVLEVLLGGVTVETGTGPTGKAVWSLPASPVLGDYVLQARTPRYSDGSDVHLQLGKLKLAGFPDLGMVEEDYAVQEGLESSMLPLDSADTWFSIISNEQAQDIPATFVGAGDTAA